MPRTPTSRSHHRPPLQERSRDSMNRILVAAETLLETRLLEDITLNDILKKARVSVGTFYARFSSREAMIPFLYDRYDRNVGEGAARVLAPERWSDLDLEARIELLLRYTVRLYRRNRGLVRALTLYARTRPEEVTGTQRKNRLDLYEAAAAILLERRSEMTHADPDRAVRFALFMAGSVFREKILNDQAPHPRAVPLTDRQLAIETTRAALAYVGHVKEAR